MYGTLTNDEVNTNQNHKLINTNNGANQDNVTTIQIEEKRKRIYSHCHVQDDTQKPGSKAPNVDKNARNRLIAASVICLVFMIAEVVGGFLSNSLAIATDAAHLLTDFVSFMISLFAIWLSSRPATRNMSFGWYRAEVLSALLSVVMIWIVTVLLVFMAIDRIRTNQFEIDSNIMVITASAGLVVNIVMAIALTLGGHEHSHFGHSHNHSHGHDHNHHHHNHSYHHDHDHDDNEHEHIQASNANSTRKDSLFYTQTSSNSQSNDSKLKPSELLTSSILIPEENNSNFNDGQTNKKKQDAKETTIQTIKSSRTHSTNATKGRGKSNINVRAAFIHIIGDFLQSLGVLLAALVIHYDKSYAIVDPICTFIFSFLVLVTTVKIIKDAMNVLMEGMPEGVNFIEVRERLKRLPSVIMVHNLRIWSLSMDKIAISTHLVIDNTCSPKQALKIAIDTLKTTYNFFEVTIQIEEYGDDMKDCEHCQDEEVILNLGSDNSGSD